MAKVIITIALREEMLRKFKAEAEQHFLKFKTLEEHPQQGKAVGQVGGIVIKELKSGPHRVYSITDGFTLKFGSPEELAALLIKFAKMSEKKDQEKTVAQIKEILRSMGLSGF